MAGPKVGSIGEYIREQRQRAKISLRQLAEQAGVSNPYLSQIERGLRKPSAEILQQIAKGLRISAEVLYVQAGILEHLGDETNRVRELRFGRNNFQQCAFAKRAGPTGEVWLTDINDSMLRVGRDRLTDSGMILPVAVCDAEKLPFPDGYFDRVSVAFGLRNMTHKDRALAEMTRVLKPGGKLLVLEFSRIAKPLSPAYDWYSFNVLPWLGKKIAKDEASYRYLAESIRMHPDQETLADMLRTAGLERVQYFNLTAGIAALHEGVRLG